MKKKKIAGPGPSVNISDFCLLRKFYFVRLKSLLLHTINICEVYSLPWAGVAVSQQEFNYRCAPINK